MLRRLPWLMCSLVAGLLLVGCEGERKQQTNLCEERPELCQATGSGLCQQKEQTLIEARHTLGQSWSDRDRYHVLKAVDALRLCIEGSSTIRISMVNESGLGRNEILALLEQERDDLLAQSQNTSDPYMLSYRWLFLRDLKAQNQLMDIVKVGLIDSPELFLALAAYYRHDDHRQATQLANKVLHLRVADNLTPDALVLLSSIRMEHEQFEEAYRLAAIAEALGETRVNLERVANLGELTPEQISQLTESVLADAELLRQGAYSVEPI